MTMELEILISKKGTRVIKATNLHTVLQLPAHHYGPNARKWLNDIYQFQDGIRKPEHLRDYAPRKLKEAPGLKDYYLSVELAKLITLNSNSKVKSKYARQLLELEEKVSRAELLDQDQVVNLLELTRAMSRTSFQKQSMQQHLEVYEQRNQGSATNWWKYRSDVLGYNLQNLQLKAQQKGIVARGRSQHSLLLVLDKYELIRTGIIDWYMAQGKSEEYAQNMGKLARQLAESMRLDIYDDRKGNNIFAPEVNAGLFAILEQTGQRA